MFFVFLGFVFVFLEYEDELNFIIIKSFRIFLLLLLNIFNFLFYFLFDGCNLIDFSVIILIIYLKDSLYCF